MEKYSITGEGGKKAQAPFSVRAKSIQRFAFIYAGDAEAACCGPEQPLNFKERAIAPPRGSSALNCLLFHFYLVHILYYTLPCE